VAAPSQRRALGALFLVLTLFFAGVAVEAATHVWPVAAAAGVLALWMASLTWQLLRRR
jgi:succinate-acetate transporter protein